MNNEFIKKLEKLQLETKEYYKNINSVYCPYLKAEVHFNREGFEHILTKTWNRGRSHKEQYTRLKLFPKVVEIIKKSHTLQEYAERDLFVRQMLNSRWEKRLKLVKYYVFVAISIKHNIRFKIIIKEIDGASPLFWSIYPSWKVNKKIQILDKKKKFYKGNPEED